MIEGEMRYRKYTLVTTNPSLVDFQLKPPSDENDAWLLLSFGAVDTVDTKGFFLMHFSDSRMSLVQPNAGHCGTQTNQYAQDIIARITGNTIARTRVP